MGRVVISWSHVYHLLWLITHALVSLVITIQRYFYLKFKTKGLDFADDVLVDQLVNELNKIPKHIAIAVNEQYIDSKSIIQLIRWCQRFNVRYVSLYSFFDVFSSLDQLESQLNDRKTNGHTKSAEDSAIRHRKNGLNGTHVNGKTRRVLSIGDTQVCVVTTDDSHQSIVNAAKHLCSQSAPIDPNAITEYLKKSYSFADPDLLLSFGESASVYGYPLWQLRLTEMYFLPTHRHFQFKHFYDIILKYSQCEQRCGK